MNDFVEHKRTSDKSVKRSDSHKRYDKYDGDEDLNVYGAIAEDQGDAEIDNLSDLLSKGSSLDSSLSVDSNIEHNSVTSNESSDSNGWF